MAGGAMTCTLCPYHETSKVNCMPGHGEPGGVVILGEAPAAEEEKQGRPFVGRSGKLLQCMIEDSGLDRFPIYKTNALRCRLPDKKDKGVLPIEHIRTCRETHLVDELLRVDPKVIVAFGGVAAESVRDERTAITRFRGTWFNWGDVPVLFTFHPAYVLRNPDMMEFVLRDLVQVRRRMEGYHVQRFSLSKIRSVRDIGSRFGFDIETNAWHLFDSRCKLTLASFAVSISKVYTQEVTPSTHQRIRRALLSAECVVGHNTAYDLIAACRELKIDLMAWEPETEDSAIAFSMKFPRYPNMSLKHIGTQFGDMPEWSSPIPLNKPYEYRNLDPHIKDEFKDYNAKDAIACLRVVEKHKPQDPTQLRIYRWLNRLNLIGARMTWFGIKIDRSAVLEYRKQVVSRMEKMARRCWPVKDLRSRKKVGEYVYNVLGLPVTEHTATGLPSTKDEVLEKLAVKSKWVRNYRSFMDDADILSRYVDPFLETDEHGFLHPFFRVSKYRDEDMEKGTKKVQGTSTGRVSAGRFSTIPRGADIKQFVQTRFGADGAIVSADYKANEVRVLADRSGDEYLCSVFADGLDIHRMTAAEIFEIPPEDVTAEQRQHVGKRGNFALIYDVSPKGLHYQVNRVWADCPYSVDDFKRFMDRLKNRMAQATEYMERLKEISVRDSQIVSPIGRIFRFPSAQQSAHERRAAANADIQSGSADICNLACDVFAEALHGGKNGYPMLTVYDSVIQDVKIAWLRKRGGESFVRNVMIGEVPLRLEQKFGWKLSVPLDVDVTIDRRWAS